MKQKQFIFLSFVSACTFICYRWWQLQSFRSLWRDEAFTWLISMYTAKDIVSISASDFAPPGYYLFTMLWQLVSHNEAWLRFSSLICILCTLALFMIFIQAELKKIDLSNSLRTIIALSALALVSIYPTLLYTSAEYRNYASLLLLITASCLLAAKFVQASQKLPFLALWTVLQLLLLYNHNLSLIWCIVHAASVVLILGLSKNWARLGAFLTACVSICVLYLPWFLQLIQQGQKEFWLEFDHIASIPEIHGLLYISETGEASWGSTASLVILIGISLSYVVYLLTKKSWQKQLTSSTLSSIYLISVISTFGYVFALYGISVISSPVYYNRYLALVSVSLLLSVLAACLLWVSRDTKSGYLVSIVLLAVMLLTIPTHMNITRNTPNADYRQLSILKQPVYTNEILDIGSCLYYAANCSYLGNIKHNPPYLGFTQLPDIAVASYADISQQESWYLYRHQHSIEALPSILQQRLGSDIFPLGEDVKVRSIRPMVQ